MSLHNCEARTVGSQVICGRCGITWDMDDDKPACRPHPARTRSAVNHRMVFLEGGEKQLGGTLTLPEVLPAPTLAAMDAAHAHGGMQAAYRVFLDMMW